MELIDFVQGQAGAVSVTDLNRLIADLPALRERFITIPSQTYPYLSDQLEFLSLVVKDQVAGLNHQLALQGCSLLKVENRAAPTESKDFAWVAQVSDRPRP